MRDGVGNIIGLRTRDSNTGSKKSVHGSAAGLFYDHDRFASIESGARVWIAEGASDTAALLTLGLNAVGIPSANSGGDKLLELGRRILPSEIVIVADGDGAGVESARLLRSELVIVAGVRIIQPPNGIKDAREWINRGASRVDLENEAGAAEIFKLDWTDGGAA
jgi:DNA primase